VIVRRKLQEPRLIVNRLTATLERQCEWEFVEELEALIPAVDAVLSLACGIGVQALAERFQGVPIYPGLNTTSLSIRQEPGVWSARCGACGDCVRAKIFVIKFEFGTWE